MEMLKNPDIYIAYENEGDRDNPAYKLVRHLGYRDSTQLFTLGGDAYRYIYFGITNASPGAGYGNMTIRGSEEIHFISGKNGFIIRNATNGRFFVRCMSQYGRALSRSGEWYASGQTAVLSTKYTDEYYAGLLPDNKLPINPTGFNVSGIFHYSNWVGNVNSTILPASPSGYYTDQYGNTYYKQYDQIYGGE